MAKIPLPVLLAPLGITILLLGSFLIIIDSKKEISRLKDDAVSREHQKFLHGIFAEQSMEVDGVTVRRTRDTTNGVVCYVVSKEDNVDVHCLWGPVIYGK